MLPLGPTPEVGDLRLWEKPDSRPMILIVLAAVALAGGVTDLITISTVQFLRTPAGVLGVLLVIAFALLKPAYRTLAQGPAKYALLFVVAAGLAEFCNFMLPDRLAPPGASLTLTMQYVESVALFLVFFDLAADPRTFKACAGAFIGTTVALSLAVNTGLVPLQTIDARVGFLALNLNVQAFMYSTAIIGVVGWLLWRWPRYRWLDAVPVLGALSMLYALVRTASRGGAAALAVGLVCVVVFSYRRSRIWAYVALVPLLVIAAYFTLPQAQVLTQRWAAAAEGAAPTSCAMDARPSIAKINKGCVCFMIYNWK